MQWRDPTMTRHFLVLSLLAILQYPAGAQVMLDSGLVAYYPFNGNANDESGNGHHGIVHGGAFLASDRFGEERKAYFFNGESAHISIPDDSAWAFGKKSFTVTTWISFDSVGANYYIIGQSEGVGLKNKWILWYDSYRLTFHTNSPSTGEIDPARRPWMPDPHRWYLLTAIRAGSSYALYIDTLLFSLGVDANDVPDAAAPLMIGSAERTDRMFHGRLDDIRIYNRALRREEFAAMYVTPAAGILPGSAWKNSLVFTPGWNTVGFEDSAWPDSLLPFGKLVSCRIQPNSEWAGDTLYLRKHFYLKESSELFVSVAIDNAFTCWINGDSLFYRDRDNCATKWDYTFEVPASKTRTGDNVVAVRATDRGFDTFFDMMVEVMCPTSNEPAVEEDIPDGYTLLQSYPNPFNPSTTIRYGLPARSHVALTVFNTLGQQVAPLQNGEQEAGYHEVRFDGSGLSSGVYFYRIQAGSFVQTRKLLLIR
jgi:hypothetical protein